MLRLNLRFLPTKHKENEKQDPIDDRRHRICYQEELLINVAV